MTLDTELIPKYHHDEVYDLNNYFSFPGFTSACREKEQTWRNKATFAQCKPGQEAILFVIDQESGVAPADVESISAMTEEKEVMYKLGQVQ